MSNTIEQGDIFNTYVNNLKIRNVIHGVNMAGVMGAGIAIQFKKYFPFNYLNYYEKCKMSVDELSRLAFVDYTEKPKYLDDSGMWYIGNLFTQIKPGKNASLDLLESSFDAYCKRLNSICYFENIVVCPAIGCGIGGLNLKDVKPIMESISSKYNIICIMVEKYSADKRSNVNMIL
jgi:O-acetyl-ADP-ribose deacetylase (regulator of RNase III)